MALKAQDALEVGMFLQRLAYFKKLRCELENTLISKFGFAFREVDQLTVDEMQHIVENNIQVNEPEKT